MADLDEIYNTRILELAGAISRTERLPDADAHGSAHSKLCGSSIAIDLKLSGGHITDYGQTVKACLLGQAAAAIVASHIVGSTPGDFREVARVTRAMLKQGGAPPTGRWSDLAVLEPVRAYRARHASTLLAFDAVEMALDQFERDGSASAGYDGKKVAAAIAQ